MTQHARQLQPIVLIIHNIRSAHNVGSLLRTADGLGVEKVFLTGYTPYPTYKEDVRLPHVAQKIDRQIHKTALGAETSVVWEQQLIVETVIKKLRASGYRIVALEQANGSTKLPDARLTGKVAVIVGREVEGLEPEVLTLADQIVEIPMSGQKESFNVAVAGAMALYHLRFQK